MRLQFQADVDGVRTVDVEGRLAILMFGRLESVVAAAVESLGLPEPDLKTCLGIATVEGDGRIRLAIHSRDRPSVPLARFLGRIGLPAVERLP